MLVRIHNHKIISIVELDTNTVKLDSSSVTPARTQARARVQGSEKQGQNKSKITE